jgi:mannosyl-oligosaccharide alpha-1,2-mannosidase
LDGIQKEIVNCRATHGFGPLKHVNYPEMGISDTQDSYLLAETFKYAFLLFSNSSVLPLEEFVFTTEGHPLRHFDAAWMEAHYAGKPGYTV